MPMLGTGRRINGKVYDISSIEVSIGSIPYEGITEISYSDTMEPGVLRGTSAYMRGRSRGMYEAEASFTIYKEDYEKIRSALVALGLGGFMEAAFQITVAYRELTGGNIPIVDTIEGCRIKHNENSHSSGNADALLTKVDLSVFRIGWNGQYAVQDGTGGIGGLIAP